MATENINIKIDVQAQSGLKSMREMRLEMRELQLAMEAAAKAGDATKFKQLEKAFADVRKELVETNANMKMLDPGEILAGFVKMGQGAVGAFSAVTGAMALFGTESEKIQEIQQRSMALIQTMMGLEQARQLLIDGGARAEMKALFETTAAQWKKIAAYITEALTIKTVEGASKSATAAQKLWNKAVAANPIFLLVAAVAALTTGIVLLVKKMSEMSEEEERQNRIRKANIEVTNNATKSYANAEIKLRTYQKIVNDTSKSEEERYGALKEIESATNGVVTATDLSADSLKTLNGELESYITTAFDVAMANAAIELATQEYVKQLNAMSDAEQFKPGFWKRLGNTIVGSLNPNTMAGYAYTVTKNSQDMVDAQTKAIEDAGKNVEAYLAIADKHMGKVLKAQKDIADAIQEKLDKEKKERDELLKQEEAARKYRQWVKDRIAAIASLERAELELQLSIATFNEDYKKELDFRKQIEELNYKETLDKYKKQLKDKLISQEQFDSIELLLKENHKNNLAAIDNQYADDELEIAEWKNGTELLMLENMIRNSVTLEERKQNEIKKLDYEYRQEKLALKDLQLLDEAEYNKRLVELDKKYALDKLEIETKIDKEIYQNQEDLMMKLAELKAENAETENERLAAQLEVLRLREEEELARYEKDEEMKTEIKKKYAKERERLEIESAQRVLQTTQDIMNTMSGIISNMMEMEIEETAKSEEDKKKIRKKYAGIQAMMSVAQITVNTAQAIMKAMADLGPVAGAISAGVLGVLGVTQIGMAMTEYNNIQKMKRGGLITGPSHERGGVQLELEGGEAVLNKNAMRIPAYRAIASSMNESTGGVPFTNVNTLSSGGQQLFTSVIDDKSLTKIVTEVTNKIVQIPVNVTETDISDTQRKVKLIEARTSF